MSVHIRFIDNVHSVILIRVLSVCAVMKPSKPVVLLFLLVVGYWMVPVALSGPTGRCLRHDPSLRTVCVRVLLAVWAGLASTHAPRFSLRRSDRRGRRLLEWTERGAL